MNEAEINAWRDIIATNTVSVMGIMKLLTSKGICTEAEIVAAVEETKKELAGAKKPAA
jgi:hypothetical protein